MPNNDFIPNILEMEDLIITNVKSDNAEMHIHFKLERKDHVCPNSSAVTNNLDKEPRKGIPEIFGNAQKY